MHGLSGNKNRYVTEGDWLTLKRQNLEYSRRRRIRKRRRIRRRKRRRRRRRRMRRRRRRRRKRRGRAKTWACLEVKFRAN